MDQPAEHASFRTRRWVLIYLVALVVVGLATAGVLLLLENIHVRKQQAREVVFRVVPIDETVEAPAEWGKNFPRQYDSYRRTVDMERTRFGGSEADPANPDQPFSKVEADPRLKIMWAGYPFSVDYREERGHAYMLTDQRTTKRVEVVNQPGACLHCHASVTLAYRRVGLENGAPGSLSDPLLSPSGQAQLMRGFAKVCAMPYAEANKLVENPVACIDCHDPESMQLRITRPAFLEGIRALAQSDDPVPHLPSIQHWRQSRAAEPYDPNRLASRQELRAMVCAQCHVEYYFRGPEKRLVYPWHRGLKAEQIQAYYDDPAGFPDGQAYKDWTHKLSGAPVIKVQHPEFELWSQGMHARSGVVCADCHMPYMREGAVKISSHHVRSPLLNVARTCQVCHAHSEEELRQRVYLIQERTNALLDRALDALIDLIREIERARASGAESEALAAAQRMQRQAQFRIDFIHAENSMGFHAPQEAARILAEAIDYAHRGQLELLGHSAHRSDSTPTGQGTP